MDEGALLLRIGVQNLRVQLEMLLQQQPRGAEPLPAEGFNRPVRRFISRLINLTGINLLWKKNTVGRLKLISKQAAA